MNNYNGWEISWDGFVPVCKRCGGEAVDRIMTKFCPNCGKNMREDNTMKDTKALFCKCGCNNGVVLKYEQEDGEAFLSLVASKFYMEQNNFIKRFVEKCRRIWAVIRNKEFYYFDIWIEKEELQEFKDFVNKMEVSD